MILHEAQQLLDNFLQDTTNVLGFQRADSLIYSRPANEATALLAFPCRLDARSNACFGGNVWLRFESLEHYLRGPVGKPIVPTISMPLHLLRENKSFTEWQFRGPDDLRNLREVILSDLRGYALPFIEQYSKLHDLRRKLASPSPKEWFVLDPEQRVNLLAVILFVQGERSGAIKILDDALLERKTALPKKRLSIEAVRRRLEEAV